MPPALPWHPPLRVRRGNLPWWGVGPVGFIPVIAVAAMPPLPSAPMLSKRSNLPETPPWPRPRKPLDWRYVAFLACSGRVAPRTIAHLRDRYGKPFTVQGISGAMKDWCTQASTPHCSSHGLRKASATRLAEAGCSPHQIMAITGHKSLKEVEAYTKAAGQKGLAKSAMARLK